MKLRKIWVLPLLLTLVCSVGCGGKADLLHGYEKVVSSMGSLARTSEHKLIGTRTCGSDNYTGAYAATCRQARGKDVVFGGCSLQARRLQVTGSVACQSGFVQLIVKNGSDELWLTPDANGNISQEITGSGGIREQLVAIRPRQCRAMRLRLTGNGQCAIFAATALYGRGSDRL